MVGAGPRIAARWRALRLGCCVGLSGGACGACAARWGLRLRCGLRRRRRTNRRLDPVAHQVGASMPGRVVPIRSALGQFGQLGPHRHAAHRTRHLVGRVPPDQPGKGQRGGPGGGAGGRILRAAKGRFQARNGKQQASRAGVCTPGRLRGGQCRAGKAEGRVRSRECLMSPLCLHLVSTTVTTIPAGRFPSNGAACRPAGGRVSPGLHPWAFGAVRHAATLRPMGTTRPPLRASRYSAHQVIRRARSCR